MKTIDYYFVQTVVLRTIYYSLTLYIAHYYIMLSLSFCCIKLMELSNNFQENCLREMTAHPNPYRFIIKRTWSIKCDVFNDTFNSCFKKWCYLWGKRPFVRDFVTNIMMNCLFEAAKHQIELFYNSYIKETTEYWILV